MGGAFGYGLSSAILAGYRFLSANYRTGDEVSIFGFSRGAFAARSLANLIDYPGLLMPHFLMTRLGGVWEAYGVYSRAINENHPDPTSAVVVRPTRKNSLARPTTVQDVPDWDTVPPQKLRTLPQSR